MNSTSPPNSLSQADFLTHATELANRIRKQDSSAVAPLYREVNQGIRWYLARHVHEGDFDAAVRTCFNRFIQVLKEEPDASISRTLLGVLRTFVSTSKPPSSKLRQADPRSVAIMMSVLTALSEGERVIALELLAHPDEIGPLCERFQIAPCSAVSLMKRVKDGFRAASAHRMPPSSARTTSSTRDEGCSGQAESSDRDNGGALKSCLSSSAKSMAS